MNVVIINGVEYVPREKKEISHVEEGVNYYIKYLLKTKYFKSCKQ